MDEENTAAASGEESELTAEERIELVVYGIEGAVREALDITKVMSAVVMLLAQRFAVQQDHIDQMHARLFNQPPPVAEEANPPDEGDTKGETA